MKVIFKNIPIETMEEELSHVGGLDEFSYVDLLGESIFSWTTSGGNTVTYNVDEKTCTYTGDRNEINEVLPHTADEWEFQYVETKQPTWHPLSNKDSKENWTTQERMDEQRYRESLLKPFRLTPFQRGY